MKNKQMATIGGGCFWCIEAIVQRLKGVDTYVSGYAGGITDMPTYRSISTGTTEHAEVVQITFDADQISYEELLMIFMTSHDPTTLNRQGADRGTQYRSVILCHDEEQKTIAEKVLQDLKGYFSESIVTEVKSLEKFYPAEKYHQNYYNRNGTAGYCRVVIDPKIQKLKMQYADKLNSVE